MKLGEFKIIGKGMFAAMVTPMDERHPEIPLVLIGDDGKYLYFSYMARRGRMTNGIITFLQEFELSQRFLQNKEFYCWLRDVVARREMVNVESEPGKGAKGQKGKGAR